MSMELSFNSPNQTVTTIADGPTSHVGATHEKAGGSSSLVSMSSTSLTRSMMDLSLMQDSQYQLHRSNVSNNNNSTVVGVDGKMGSGPQAPHTQQHQQHHQLITDSNSPSDASHGTTTFFSIASPENSSPFLKDHASPLLRQQQQQQIQQHQLHDSQKAVLIGAAPNSGVTVTVGTASAAIARVQQHPAQPAIVGVPQQRKTNLYVSSLPKHFSEGDLLQMFQRYGNVVSCMAARDAVGGCKGYGFVNFANEASATQAISELHGLLLQGRMLHVRLADPRANPPPTLKQAVPQIVAPSQVQSGNAHPYQQSQQNPVHVHQQVYTAHQQQMFSHQQTQSQSASSYQQHQQQHYFVEPPQQQQHQQQQHVLPPNHQQQQHQQQQQHLVYREPPHQQALGIDYQQQAHYAQQQQHQTPYAHQQQSMQFHYPTERRDSGDSTASGMGGSLSALTVHSAAAFQGYSQDEYYAAQQRQQQQQQQQQQHHQQQQQQQQQHSRQHPFSYPHHQQQPQQPHQQQAVAYQHQLQAAQQHRQAVALHPPTQGYPQQHQAPHLLQQQQHAYRVMQPGSFSHQSNGPTVLSTGDEVRYVRERTRGPSEYTYDSIIS